MADIQKSYIGVGKLHARTYGTTGRMRHVGNVSKLDPSHKLATKKQPDFTRPGGGTAARIDRIEAIELGMTFLSFSPENFALAVAGTATAVTSGTVTAEAATAYLGSTVRLAGPPSAITSVNNGATVYTAGTDYEMSASGIYIPDGSTIPDAQAITVTYTRAAHSRIEAAMNSGVELEMAFEGLNEADTNKAVLFEAFRVLVPAADVVSFIGDDFAKQDYKAECLKDASKGSGVSAFYRVLART
jgi:hypothetical protein